MTHFWVSATLPPLLFLFQDSPRGQVLEHGLEDGAVDAVVGDGAGRAVLVDQVHQADLQRRERFDIWGCGQNLVKIWSKFGPPKKPVFKKMGLYPLFLADFFFFVKTAFFKKFSFFKCDYCVS